MIVIALVLGLSLGHNADVVRQGQWRLKVAANAFSGAVDCTLKGRDMDYRREAVILHFSKQTDTSQAVYRIDNDDLITVSADSMTLAAQGFQLTDDDLGNPSGGLVRIPLARLAGGRTIAVAPNPKAKPKTFDVRDLSSILAIAHQRGCRFD